MAEKVRYPQIPSTVWWGVRAILHKTPNVTVDERLLGVQLGVQEAAARAYINELKNVGILTEEGKATPIAQKWRLDESYAEAVSQIVKDIYPEGLLHLAPPGDADRQKVVSWFLHEGLGQGSAGNKAATYLLISSPTPNEAPRSNAKSSQGDGAPKTRSPRSSRSVSKNARSSDENPTRREGNDRNVSPPRTGADAFPLNINVQIHISADAGSEQIESIFQAMRRYLYDAPDS
ncbi:DUF5343 domain-containing protein [Novosphingobium malaysiense]|uniref:DUF5343 domain-containing protein n=1 Tax=Novosphingobium malaysiense TaxID=1348853 RepID=A0A0B1ZJZ2_9SPHN|nr:DUF5343 domain-containing protein [Novosphingobium malaysiense]KHK91445.1 hypothetical protein LK12_11435 [Novosphingobium malaysiense]